MQVKHHIPMLNRNNQDVTVLPSYEGAQSPAPKAITTAYSSVANSGWEIIITTIVAIIARYLGLRQARK